MAAAKPERRRVRPARPEPVRAPLRLRIEKLVAGGAGLGRHDGRVVLATGAAAGDLLDVTVVVEHAGYLEARLRAVIEPGPGRREPPCPHARSCGGCTWQHVTIEAQVEAKVAILRESFERVGKIAPPETIAVHRSPEWGYRRRARFHLARERDGSTRLGFIGQSGQGVVVIGPCPVLTPALEAALGAVREGAPARAAEVSAFDGEGGVSVSGASVRVFGERLEVPASAFFQGNAPLLEAFVARVVDRALPDRRESRVFDLYAGVGLFALPLARRSEEVIAVEGAATAAAALARNASAAGLANLRVENRSVETAIALSGSDLAGSVVVVDPPREGLPASVREALAGKQPRRLVYVACDPASLARDAGALVRAGMRLVALDLFDLFPQTHHLEAVALFESGALR